MIEILITQDNRTSAWTCPPESVLRDARHLMIAACPRWQRVRVLVSDECGAEIAEWRATSSAWP